MPETFDQPLDKRRRAFRRSRRDSDATGVIAERIARFTGTPRFIIWLTLFVVLWLVWNSFGPVNLRFDSAALGFTALTLMLSLQASYASPLILLAQNRQDARDRVSAQQDRQQAERNLADTEFITRKLHRCVCQCGSSRPATSSGRKCATRWSRPPITNSRVNLPAGTTPSLN